MLLKISIWLCFYKNTNDIIFNFLLDPDCWCRMGFCRFSPHEGNISMGWSKRNRIWLEIYAKKLWCKYRLGEFTNITRFCTSFINFDGIEQLILYTFLHLGSFFDTGMLSLALDAPRSKWIWKQYAFLWKFIWIWHAAKSIPSSHLTNSTLFIQNSSSRPYYQCLRLRSLDKLSS